MAIDGYRPSLAPQRTRILTIVFVLALLAMQFRQLHRDSGPGRFVDGIPAGAEFLFPAFSFLSTSCRHSFGALEEEPFVLVGHRSGRGCARGCSLQYDGECSRAGASWDGAVVLRLARTVPDHSDAWLSLPTGSIAHKIVSNGFDSVEALLGVVPWFNIVREISCDQACYLWCSYSKRSAGIHETPVSLDCLLTH
jgi:hypothetical protein